MSNSGLYIGIPNGVMFCVDEPLRQGIFKGRLYHGYAADGIDVISFEEVIHVMGRLFDDLQFPRASLRERSFLKETEVEYGPARRKERLMSDKEMLTKHGDIGTFIVRVQQRQNSTWQGRITWVEEDKTVRFRSLLEMIKLIESGVNAEHPELEHDQEPAWD